MAGSVSEWFKVPVLKTGISEKVSGVRILPDPSSLHNYNYIKRLCLFVFGKTSKKEENHKSHVFITAFQEKLKCLPCFGLRASGLLLKKIQGWSVVLFPAFKKK